MTWHTAKYGEPYSEFMLCIYPFKCTHTAVNTHTPWTHTRRSGQPLCCGAGEQLEVRCLAQGHLSHDIEGGESAGHSLPHRQSLPGQDSTSQPFEYESDSLILGHDFLRFMNICILSSFWKNEFHESVLFIESKTYITTSVVRLLNEWVSQFIWSEKHTVQQV